MDGNVIKDRGKKGGGERDCVRFGENTRKSGDGVWEVSALRWVTGKPR